MAWERRKKLILKLNPSLKFMAEDNKSFVSAAPMLFGEEFAKQATTTVDQVKAMKKLNFPPEKVFLDTTPKAVAGVQPRVAVQDTSPIRGEDTRWASHSTAQSGTKELDLSPNVVNCSKEIIICHHTSSLKTVLPSVKREIKSNLHAGRIKEFKENWALLTQDPWVLQTVQGFQLPLSSHPAQTSVPPQLQLSLAQQELISIEIQAMSGKQAIRVIRSD